MTTNGFKHPAPVLPAMGVHSFHNDSPPFAAAASRAEPEYINLDHSPNTRNFSRITSPTPDHTPTSQPRHVSFPSASPLPADDYPPQRISAEDENQIASRSRRLVSGNIFGNSPTPAPVVERRMNGAFDDRPDEHQTRQRTPTPPETNSDSPPLTEPPTSLSSPTRQTFPLTPNSLDFNLSLSEPRESSGSLAKRRSSRTRDRDTGYDALNGLNDGEADLDESAPQANFGSEAYMRGVEGVDYQFPRHRLRRSMKDESKIPVVIVACGSFSPPTYLHLRMFEMAKDEIVESQTYEIMAGYYSPVKSGLAPALHRVRMCELAVEHTSTWLMVDPWEAGQPEYKRTAVVLDHFDEMLNGDGEGCVGGLTMSDGKKSRYKVMLLAGGDLIESFGEPGVWSEPDLHIILGRFGCLIVERAGSDVWAFLLSHDILYHHRRNVVVIKQLIYNDISSTKVRLFVRRGMSIKYLLPNSVIQYIVDHKLYRESDVKAVGSQLVGS